LPKTSEISEDKLFSEFIASCI